MMQPHPILNQYALQSAELRRGNIICYQGANYTVESIAANAIEVAPAYGGEMAIYQLDQLQGYKLIQGYGDVFVTNLLLDNSFTRLSEIDFRRIYTDGSQIDIRIDYLHNRWNITFDSLTVHAYYLHDFQNIFFALLRQELIINKQFQ